MGRAGAGTRPSRAERDRAVDDLIALVTAVDGILQMQATADAGYFAAVCGRTVGSQEADGIGKQFLKAYRWQSVFSGASHPRFQKFVKGMITEAQFERISAALATLN